MGNVDATTNDSPFVKADDFCCPFSQASRLQISSGAEFAGQWSTLTQHQGSVQLP